MGFRKRLAVTAATFTPLFLSLSLSLALAALRRHTRAHQRTARISPLHFFAFLKKRSHIRIKHPYAQ